MTCLTLPMTPHNLFVFRIWLKNNTWLFKRNVGLKNSSKKLFDLPAKQIHQMYFSRIYVAKNDVWDIKEQKWFWRNLYF
jgi:hypothetical protein